MANTTRPRTRPRPSGTGAPRSFGRQPAPTGRFGRQTSPSSRSSFPISRTTTKSKGRKSSRGKQSSGMLGQITSAVSGMSAGKAASKAKPSSKKGGLLALLGAGAGAAALIKQRRGGTDESTQVETTTPVQATHVTPTSPQDSQGL
jgi:hypothetical protein